MAYSSYRDGTRMRYHFCTLLLSFLRSHISTEFAQLGSSNNVDVHVEAMGNWWEADPSSKWMRMAAAAVNR